MANHFQETFPRKLQRFVRAGNFWKLDKIEQKEEKIKWVKERIFTWQHTKESEKFLNRTGEAYQEGQRKEMNAQNYKGKWKEDTWKHVTQRSQRIRMYAVPVQLSNRYQASWNERENTQNPLGQKKPKSRSEKEKTCCGHFSNERSWGHHFRTWHIVWEIRCPYKMWWHTTLSNHHLLSLPFDSYGNDWHCWMRFKLVVWLWSHGWENIETESTNCFNQLRVTI